MTIRRTGHFSQDGHAVQGFAIRKTTDALRIIQAANPSLNGHLKFIGHQANLGMLRTVCERAGSARRTTGTMSNVTETRQRPAPRGR